MKIYGEEGGENLLMTNTNTTNGYKQTKGKIVEKELSYELNGIFFDIHREIGRYGREKQYADLLEKKLKERGIEYKREQRIGDFVDIVDFIVENKIVIELKAKTLLLREDFNQVKRYLNATQLELGILVNFRDSYIKPKRVLSPNVGSISSDLDEFVVSDRSRSFVAQLPWKRSIIILSGVLMNFILGWFLISAVLMTGTPEGVIITGATDNSPAYLSGVKPGDRILDFIDSATFTEFIKENAGKEISFNVRRGSEKLTIKATTRENPPQGEGALGVSLIDGGGRLGFATAILEGLKTTITLIGLIIGSFVFLIKGLILGSADLAGVVGPIGIFNVAGEAGSLGLVYFLNLLALISINLGVINILPFPALDGGRLLFILIEKVKGSPLPQKFEQLTNGIGFALLIALMVVITLRDISNLV